jgi:hypothetical protein
MVYFLEFIPEVISLFKPSFLDATSQSSSDSSKCGSEYSNKDYDSEPTFNFQSAVICAITRCSFSSLCATMLKAAGELSTQLDTTCHNLSFFDFFQFLMAVL